MNTFIIFLVAFISYLVFWFALNVLAYFISIVFKSKKPIQMVTGLGMVILYLLNFAIGIWMIWIGLNMLFEGEIFWLIVYILIGASILSYIFSFIQMPFIFITVYFSEKIEDIDFNETATRVDILNEKGEIVARTERGSESLSRMAMYFVILYGLNLFHALFISPDTESVGWGFYIVNPFSGVVFMSLVTGVPYGIFNKINNKPFFTRDKKDFFVDIWRAGTFITIGVIFMLYMMS